MYIGDAECEQLRKYASLFMEYRSTSAWSPPEVLSSDNRKPNDNSPNKVALLMNLSDNAEFFPDKRTIDIYSIGFLLWELETDQVPLDGCSPHEIKKTIVEQKMRPEIPSQTDFNLA